MSVRGRPKPLTICGMSFRSLAHASLSLGMNRDYVRWTILKGTNQAKRVMLEMFRELKLKESKQ